MQVNLTALAFVVAAGVVSAAKAAEPPDLDGYLKVYLHTPDQVGRSVAEVDLNGDGRNEVIVYITEPTYCGSGGCVALVLERVGSTYRVRMRSTVTWPPIRVLSTRHHGWRDIVVRVSGGGSRPGDAVMRFDGHRYRSNPTMAPAPERGEPGVTVIPG